MVKYSEVPMGDKSDLDRLTDGQEGREIIIVATWLRPTKLIGLIDLFLALICYLVAEILRYLFLVQKISWLILLDLGYTLFPTIKETSTTKAFGKFALFQTIS